MEDIGAQTGTVVVIDVIRACTSAAAALGAGAAAVVCVATVSAALELGRREPRAVLAGEEWGLPPDGFDLGNSPEELARADLGGRTLVLLSQNGTPTLTAVGAAGSVLAAGLTNVGATARWIRRHRPEDDVTIVVSDDTGEDEACAEHLAELLSGGRPDSRATVAKVREAADRHLRQWRRFHPPQACRDFIRDAAACAEIDVHVFAMVGRANGSAVRLSPARPDTRASEVWP